MDCPCTTCYQILKGTASLTAHNRRFHPNADEEQLKCSVCDKPFARPHDLKRHTSKHHSFPCESEENKNSQEAEENKSSQEENQISKPCLNIELNNEDENYEEMENEDISGFESNKRDGKSTEGSGIPETCVDIEQSSDIGSNIGNENVLLSYEEMEASEMDNSDSNKGADNPKALTESHETTFDASNELQCDFCSKSFKYRNGLRRHINRIHNDKTSKDRKRDITSSKDKSNISKIKETLNNHTGFILKNADNILDLLNTQNQNSDQIKKIHAFLSCRESSTKSFECTLCGKYFSTKGSLYSHRSQYHKQRGKLLKCEKCGDSIENATALAIHNFRWHSAPL